MMFKKESPLI